jgi:hypothetical protein
MTRRRQTLFFATRADLSPGLAAIEGMVNLQYVSDRVYRTRQVEAYRSAFEIPDLGRVRIRVSERYLVLPRQKQAAFRRIVEIPRVRPGWRRSTAMLLAFLGIRLPRGSVRFEVWHADHPGSVEFAPGGLYGESVLVAGQISTALSDLRSTELYDGFVAEVLRGFERIKSFRVGPEARALLDAGMRLAIDVEASAEIDLRR